MLFPSRSNILEENKLIELADGKLIITFYFEHIKAFYSLEKEEDNSQVGFWKIVTQNVSFSNILML